LHSAPEHIGQEMMHRQSENIQAVESTLTLAFLVLGMVWVARYYSKRARQMMVWRGLPPITSAIGHGTLLINPAHALPT